MGKFKSVVSIALVVAILAGICGCAQKIVLTPPTTATSETSASETDETTEETKETETSETESTESGETKASESSESKESAATSESGSESSTAETTANSKLHKVTVSNAYKRSFKVGKKSVTTRYPKITIQGVSTTKVNKEIANKFKPIAKKNKSRIYYSYYVRKYLISIVITVEVKAGSSANKNYYVYNISRINGKKLTRAQVLQSLGMKSSTFNSKVKAGIQNMWKTKYKKDTSTTKKDLEKKSLTTKTLNSAMPYVNSKGKIAYLVRQIEVPGSPSHIDLYGTC